VCGLFNGGFGKSTTFDAGVEETDCSLRDENIFVGYGKIV